MNDVAIIGVGLHPFGRFEGKSAMQMGVDAIFAAVGITDDPDAQAEKQQLLELLADADNRVIALSGKWGVDGVISRKPVPSPYLGSATSSAM